MPGGVRPGDHPRPSESALSQRSGALCPPGSAQQMPAGGPPPARQDVVSQRSSTLCPPGSDRRPSLAIHRKPARRSSSQRTGALCPPENHQQIRAGGSPPAGDRSGSRRSGTLGPPETGPQIRDGGSLPTSRRSGYPSGRARGARLVVARRRGECHRTGCPVAAGRRWRRRSAESKASSQYLVSRFARWCVHPRCRLRQVESEGYPIQRADSCIQSFNPKIMLLSRIAILDSCYVNKYKKCHKCSNKFETHLVLPHKITLCTSLLPSSNNSACS